MNDYRDLYRRERDNLLQNEEIQEQDPYASAVYSTWKLSYDKLDPSAQLFLQICSLLHPEGIAEEMFEKAALSQSNLRDSELQNDTTKLLNQLGKQDSGWSSWTFRKVVMCLGSHSLIEYDHQNHTYSIHPLVHHWSGTTIEGNKIAMQKHILTIIGLSVSWTFTDEDYKYRRTLLKHLTNSMASLEPTEIDPLVAGRVARIYFEQACWKEAEALEVVVMEKRKRELGADHPNTLATMGILRIHIGIRAAGRRQRRSRWWY